MFFNNQDLKYVKLSPMQTVNKVKDILAGLGILAEERWTNMMDGFYSVTLCIFGSSIEAKGKGASPDEALASGYCELFGRIRSGCWNGSEHDSYSEMKFINMKDGRIQYIPAKKLNALYGINGICADVNSSKALIRGICGILETHARNLVMNKKVIPPTIPESYIEKHPLAFKLIKKIEKVDSVRIIIKDCSLGEGFPVVAAIFSDLLHQTYLVEFGAHPVFEAAVEKSLFNIMQDGNFKKPFLMHKFSYFDASIFTGKSNCGFKGYNGVNSNEDKLQLDFLYRMLTEKGCDILVRDTSLPDFPSYQVIVPALCENIGFNIEASYKNTAHADKNTALSKKNTASQYKNWNSYVKCLRDYNAMRSDKLGKDKISHILKNFYPKILVENIISESESPNKSSEFIAALNVLKMNSMNCLE